MDYIEEIGLPERVSDIATSDYIRTVEQSSGKSEKTPKSLFTWLQSQITGLPEALALLTPKEATAALKSMVAYVKSNGEPHGSGFTMGDVTALTIDSILNGFHVASTPFTIANVGTVIAVYAGGNVPTGEAATGATPTTSVQMVVTLNGIFCRTFSTTWGNYMYVGGSTTNISLSRAEIITLMGEDKLTPLVGYRVIDHPNGEVVITAASSNSFFYDGFRLGYAPAHLQAGTFDTKVWIGTWYSTITAPIDSYCVLFNRVYKNKTGNRGSITGYALDSTNWDLMDYLEAGIYIPDYRGCTYNIKNDGVSTVGFISKEWDFRGNEFGMSESEAGTFLTEYNQWGDPLVFNNNADAIYNNHTATGGLINDNSCRFIRNNVITSGCKISGSNGHGDIYNTVGCNISECTMPDENNNIRYLNGTTLYKNILGGTADIQYLATGSNLTNNIINGDVEGDSSAYAVVTMSDSTIGANGKISNNPVVNISLGSRIETLIEKNGIVTIIASSIGSGATYVDNNAELYIVRSIVNGSIRRVNTKLWMIDSQHYGYITACGVVRLTNTIVEPTATISGVNHVTYGYLNSVLAGQTYSEAISLANKTVTMAVGKIVGSYYVGTGSFTIPTGGTYSDPTIVSGCAKTEIRKNGVTLNISSGIGSITAEYAGWYTFKYDASAFCATNDTNFEAALHVNGVLKQQGYNIKNYHNIDGYISSGFCTEILLAVGDVLTVKYKHNIGSTVTFTLGQVNYDLIYNN